MPWFGEGRWKRAGVSQYLAGGLSYRTAVPPLGVASTGSPLVEVSTRTTALSQWFHGGGRRVKKPLSECWHQCECGVGPVQRDLYSALLAAYLDPVDPIPSCARYQPYWEGEELEAWADLLELPLLSRGEVSVSLF
ncbi:hypothetical protein KSX_54750 [Ktedonospora formicarum]|uniref:Uncharacterized protein n=1 Tax=Ktedonospora formicarum TaxID=2778364 RepID=A0A8J3HZU8_9CHLR|nr:hypothetical protein KSX_54750 [Ktedonospora formicarum]